MGHTIGRLSNMLEGNMRVRKVAARVAESAVISTSADQSDEGGDHAVIFTSADQDVEAASDPAVISTSADQGGANIPSEVDAHGDDGPTCVTDFAEPVVISTSTDQPDEDGGHAVISNSNSADQDVEATSDPAVISTSADQGGVNISSVEPVCAAESIMPTADVSIHGVNTYSMMTRSKAEIFKPKLYHLQVEEVPATIHEALDNPDWKTAVMTEYNALLEVGTC
ncbi:hypothetical protein V6N13_035637 [Hibiscus sabdariffa]